MVSARLLGISALIACALIGAADAPARRGNGPAHESGDLRRAKLFQEGRKLVLAIRTAAPVPLTSLDRLPKPEQPGRATCAWKYANPGTGPIVSASAAKS